MLSAVLGMKGYTVEAQKSQTCLHAWYEHVFESFAFLWFFGKLPWRGLVDVSSSHAGMSSPDAFEKLG